MPTTIRVAHSPDSDDAFMFYALAEGKIDTCDLRYVHELADIESLNQRARRAELEVTAVSIHAYAYIWREYALLGSGSSMGDGYGPRLVSPRPVPGDPRDALRGLRVAVPGRLTTAYLALKLYQPDVVEVVVPFDAIEDAVHSGQADVGLLIHEGQLTYADSGLTLWADLGAWWLGDTGLPLPLGGNAVRRDPADRPRPPGEHRLRAGTPRAGADPRQAVQPRHRRRAHRHLCGDVRESVDRGLWTAWPGSRTDPAEPRIRSRNHPGAGDGGVRRVIDPPRSVSYLPNTP
jgi:predicted solute-binding protein